VISLKQEVDLPMAQSGKGTKQEKLCVAVGYRIGKWK